MKNYLKAFLAMGAFLFASVGLADTEPLNAQDFESLTAGAYLDVTTEVASKVDKSPLWKSSEAVDGSMGELAVVTAYADGEKRPSSGGVNNNYLKLETGAPLYRQVYNLDPTVDEGQPQPIGSGLYFEGDVQFSPYEDDVPLTNTDGTSALDQGTKLLVYIKGDEATAATNFVVVAGYYNNDNDITEKKYYVCDDIKDFDYSKETWHHLVIKAYLTDDGNYSYFKVFVDGTALTCADEKGTSESSMADIGKAGFPSMDKGSATTLSGIGFKGTGSVDNLKWTTVDPDPTKVMIAYVWSNGEFSLKVNGKDKTVVSGDAYEFNENDTREVTFKPNDDYSFDETTDVTESIKDGVTTYTYTPQKAGAVVTVGDTVTYVKDLVAAVTLVNAQTVDVTLKMLTDATITSTDSIVTVEDVVASIYIGSENNTVTLILNEKTLSIANMGLFANGGLIIIDKSQDTVTDTGCIITENDEGAAGTIYAPTMTVYGGKFDTRPCTDDEEKQPVVVPSGYELPTDADSDGWYRLKKTGGSTEPVIDGGDDGATTVDTETKTIKVESSTSGEITITGDASAYTISVPQNVTKITGNVGTITIMGKGVDITGAFTLDSATTAGVTTIKLDPDGSVEVNGVKVSVTPELDTDTEGTEPFAVGDSVSATVKAIPGLTYQLLGSEDLTSSATKDWGTVGEAVTATNSGTVTLEDTSTDKPAAKFYVIKVSR